MNGYWDGTLIDSYRGLVLALAAHTFVGHEGHDLALADLKRTEPEHWEAVQRIIDWQHNDLTRPHICGWCQPEVVGELGASS